MLIKTLKNMHTILSVLNLVSTNSENYQVPLQKKLIKEKEKSYFLVKSLNLYFNKLR